MEKDTPPKAPPEKRGRSIGSLGGDFRSTGGKTPNRPDSAPLEGDYDLLRTEEYSFPIVTAEEKQGYDGNLSETAAEWKLEVIELLEREPLQDYGRFFSPSALLRPEPGSRPNSAPPASTLPLNTSTPNIEEKEAGDDTLSHAKFDKTERLQSPPLTEINPSLFDIVRKTDIVKKIAEETGDDALSEAKFDRTKLVRSPLIEKNPSLFDIIKKVTEFCTDYSRFELVYCLDSERNDFYTVKLPHRFIEFFCQQLCSSHYVKEKRKNDIIFIYNATEYRLGGGLSRIISTYNPSNIFASCDYIRDFIRFYQEDGGKNENLIRALKTFLMNDSWADENEDARLRWTPATGQIRHFHKS